MIRQQSTFSALRLYFLKINYVDIHKVLNLNDYRQQ